MTAASITRTCATPDLRELLAPFSAKRIARASGAHPKTTERWRRGEAIPTGDAVLRMMASDDALYAALLSAAGRATDGQRAVAASHLRDALIALGAA